jgi:hypothetical protein
VETVSSQETVLANETLPNRYELLSHDALVKALAETPPNPWPTIDDRAAWERLAATTWGAGMRDDALRAATEYAQVPGVRLPTLSEFMAFTRTGDRATWERASDALWQRLEGFALAACFTGEATWTERAADALWAVCEMTTWVTPAHEAKAVPGPDDPYVDLWAAEQAQAVAETLQVLGPALDRIDPRIVRRARRELDKRVFDPFLARSDFWWLWPQDGHPLNNWTAVCSGGVLVAALAALNDDPERQARVVGKARWSLSFFKDTFGPAGSLDEGASYWGYGMSYFVMAAERLAARTRGRMDPLADPIWREVARFPLRVRLYGDTFVNFSDCSPNVHPDPGWIAWLGSRLAAPGLAGWADRLVVGARIGGRHRHLPSALRTLLWLETRAERGGGGRDESESGAYLPDVQWLIARSDSSDDALILAAKGGHNAENHNHNDGGSFIVHYRQEPLIAELGAPTYTRQFFSGTRYENIAARSLGHSVPFVNGREQQAGRAFAAQVLAQDDASLTLELCGLYPTETGLISLTRRVALDTGSSTPVITLADHATFRQDGGTLALPLITLAAAVEVTGPGRAHIAGQRGTLVISWPPDQATCRAEEVPVEDPKFLGADGRTRIRRLWFDITVSGKEARIDLTMTPASSG